MWLYRSAISFLPFHSRHPWCRYRCIVSLFSNTPKPYQSTTAKSQCYNIVTSWLYIKVVDFFLSGAGRPYLASLLLGHRSISCHVESYHMPSTNSVHNVIRSLAEFGPFFQGIRADTSVGICVREARYRAYARNSVTNVITFELVINND